MRILYIDDESNTEKMASKFDILKSEGIEVHPVDNIGDVLPTLQKIAREIDLIVLDIIMPPEDIYGLDETNGGTTTGLRLLKDIRIEHPNHPLIIVSVRRKQVSGEFLKEMNVAEYLEKPILAADIAKTIKRVLSKH